MAKPLLPDASWDRIRPLLPPPKPRRDRCPGRKAIDDRRALIGILFVLKTGVPWEDLPQEMGCGSGMTWAAAPRLAAGRGLASAARGAPGRAERGRSDRLIAGGGRQPLVAGLGRRRGGRPEPGRQAGEREQAPRPGRRPVTPPAATLTAANAPDVKEAEHVVEAVPPVGGRPGRPRRRPRGLLADRGCDSEGPARPLACEGPPPQDRPGGDAPRQRPGQVPLGVERTISWMKGLRRMRIRYDRLLVVREAWATPAVSVICYRLMHDELAAG